MSEKTDRDAPSIGRIVVFDLDDQRYAIPVDRVQEIQQIVRPTRVPDTSPELLGMVDIRGGIVPAIDLRVLLGLGDAAYDLKTPMIIGRIGELSVALVVDAVHDVVDVPDGCTQSASGIYEMADKLLGVCRLGEGLVFVLDIESLLPESRLSAVSAALSGEGA